MPKRKAKTPAKPRPNRGPRVPQPVLVAQPNGGALMAAGQGQGGRPKEVLRQRCREAIESRAGIDFVARVMDGSETEDVLVSVGEKQVLEKVRPKIRDRLLAFELLADRGYGKPDQSLNVRDVAPRPTGEETMRRILALLPRVIPMLPIERKGIAKLFAERREIEVLVAGKDVSEQ